MIEDIYFSNNDFLLTTVFALSNEYNITDWFIYRDVTYLEGHKVAQWVINRIVILIHKVLGKYNYFHKTKTISIINKVGSYDVSQQ